MISVYRERFLAWRCGLSARERQLLALMTLLIVSCAAYYGAWAPAAQRLDEARHAYVEQWKLLQWVQSNASQVETPSGDAEPADDTTPLPVLLTQTASESGIPIARLDAGADGKATLTLDHVSFNRLILWLDKLQHSYRVTPLSATITASDTPGQVSATLQMEHF